jgi:hypothetical protein
LWAFGGDWRKEVPFDDEVMVGSWLPPQ